MKYYPWDDITHMVRDMHSLVLDVVTYMAKACAYSQYVIKDTVCIAGSGFHFSYCHVQVLLVVASFAA